MSSRPKSMSDFQSLMDAAPPLNGQGLPRKKPSSLSLAAGLMMTSESPRTYSTPDTPAAQSASAGRPWSDNLFFAYAQKVYTTVLVILAPLELAQLD